MNLLSRWKHWRPSAAPFALREDLAVLNADLIAKPFIKSWRQAYKRPDFPPNDSLLHLSLIPQPFFGDLRQASVYVLGLNPGVGPHDYYGEYKVPSYRRALLTNLRQKFGPGSLPFIFLDPRFSWHGGFRWWHGKLAMVIGQLANAWCVSPASARETLARELASLELVPYHSSTFRDGSGSLRNLPSARLVRAFARDFVLPRVARGEAIAIVLRQAPSWGLPKRPGITQYTSQEARAAHLTPESRGGKAILNHLLRRYPRANRYRR